jgi:hypothetical protein
MIHNLALFGSSAAIAVLFAGIIYALEGQLK